MKRTTEAVLRAEVEAAERELEAIARKVEAAQATVKEALRRKTEIETRRAETAERIRRAKAALAAFLPLPLPTRDVAREDVEDGVPVASGDRIHELDNSVTTVGRKKAVAEALPAETVAAEA